MLLKLGRVDQVPLAAHGNFARGQALGKRCRLACCQGIYWPLGTSSSPRTVAVCDTAAAFACH